MSEARRHPLEVVLRLIAQAAPHPWHPYRVACLDRRVLDDVLEVLWLEGLIQKAPPTLEEGPAVELTPLGRRVEAEPELLQRLCEGRAIDPTMPATVIRANLSHPPRAWVYRVILGANIAVFLWGLLLALRAGAAKNFLIGFTLGQAGMDVLHTTGSLRGDYLLEGQWWRLITSGFNHLGVLHIGVNMYSLYSVGTFIEQRWGWWRFLIIYFVSIWTGSCLAMTYQPQVMTVGASGGLFGVFAAVIAWLMLYGKHLPAASRRGLWRNVIMNIMILAVMSYTLRNVVSHWGHIGGAIGGFVTCFVLHFQRFGGPVLRWLAVPLILLLPAGGWKVLRHGMATQPRWAAIHRAVADAERKVETEEFEKTFIPTISRKTRKAVREFDRIDDQVIGLHPTRRDKAKVQKALAQLAEDRTGLEELAVRLERQPPYMDETVEEARKTGLVLVQSIIELCAKAEEVLQQGEKGKKPNKADDEKLDELRQKVKEELRAWNKLLG